MDAYAFFCPHLYTATCFDGANINAAVQFYLFCKLCCYQVSPVYFNSLLNAQENSEIYTVGC